MTKPSGRDNAVTPAPETELVLIDHERTVPQKAASGIDAQTKAVQRIALALEAGASAAVEPVSQLHFDTLIEGKAPASLAALASDLDCYVDWCMEHRHTAFPADPETLVGYIEHRAAAEAKVATIRRRIASIAAAHELLKLNSDGVRARLVRTKLSTLAKEGGRDQRQAVGVRLGADDSRGKADGVDGGPSLLGLLAACDEGLTGLRDGALLSAGYDAGLRVGELTAMTLEDLELKADGTGRFIVRRSKTDQEGKGEWVWLSADTMRRIGKWIEAAAITTGVVFRRVHVTRRKPRAAIARQAWDSIPGQTRHYRDRADGKAAEPGMVVYTPGEKALTRQGVNEIYRRVAEKAWLDGHIDVAGGAIDDYLAALSSHSLRVGLTQDMIAAGLDGVAIAQALRWKSTARVLHYGKKLAPDSGAAQSLLGSVRR